MFWSDNRRQEGCVRTAGRVLESGIPGKEIVISKASGSDVFVVATTDSQGTVWVAWQGWRNGKAVIFAATQQGDGFTAPQAVSNSSANEWNPAIAADSRGRVTIAWDSYPQRQLRHYARTATASGTWDSEIAVAATARYEAYPSIVYDPQGRLWIAYEEGAEGWGKDWGAHNSSGVPLYDARAIRLVGLDASGRLIDPGVDPGVALPGVAADSIRRYDRQAGKQYGMGEARSGTMETARPERASFPRRKSAQQPAAVERRCLRATLACFPHQRAHSLGTAGHIVDGIRNLI